MFLPTLTVQSWSSLTSILLAFADCGEVTRHTPSKAKTNLSRCFMVQGFTARNIASGCWTRQRPSVFWMNQPFLLAGEFGQSGLHSLRHGDILMEFRDADARALRTARPPISLGQLVMTEITTRLDTAQGQPAQHVPLAELEARLSALPPAPKDTGRLALIVRRPAKDAREVLDHVRLSPEAGLPGDNWSSKPAPDPTAQLTVMQVGVAELIANGQPLALFGDNLFVDLDLSVTNLPVGSRLRVGGAVVEVTPMPHDGCSKFNARFGHDALRLVNAKPTRHLNLRGIYWRVIEPGEIEVGSTVEVLSRLTRS